MRIAALTIAAMFTFAANSLLCRLALGQQAIDPASFTTIRVASGAATLWLIFFLQRAGRAAPKADWRAAVALAAYMIFFSFAYVTLSAGAGALILFGAVQITMFSAALRGGESFSAVSWAGLVLAVAGLAYLVLPGLAAPDPLGAVMMGVAGLAWGVYSLLGRGGRDPLGATATNFLWCLPLVVIVSLAILGNETLSANGVALAVASGAIASGCGYVIWYAALAGLTATRAAVVQLSVPVIAAIGGVLLLSESVTLRLVLASAATLGGVAIVLAQRAAHSARSA